MLQLFGAAAFSNFRLDKILTNLRQINPELSAVQANYFFRATTAQARAQDLSDVLDSTFTPASTDPAAVSLFDVKQRFMYAVAERTLLTDYGKALVRKYEDTYNVQQIYKDLRARAETSVNAHINSGKILAYITSAKVDTWRGTTQSFVLHWQDQV